MEFDVYSVSTSAAGFLIRVRLRATEITELANCMVNCNIGIERPTKARNCKGCYTKGRHSYVVSPHSFDDVNNTVRSACVVQRDSCCHQVARVQRKVSTRYYYQCRPQEYKCIHRHQHGGGDHCAPYGHDQDLHELSRFLQSTPNVVKNDHTVNGSSVLQDN